MRRLKALEKQLGKLTTRDIWKTVYRMLREAGIRDFKIIPYVD